MVINIGINGFGRIGRVIFRTCLQHEELKVTAVNDPAVDLDYICYLIKYDSTHGKFKGNVQSVDNKIIINGVATEVFHEKQPTKIPWHKAEVQCVVEASGMFTTLEKASGHLHAESVVKVIVAAPSVDVPMIVLGVNDNTLTPEMNVMSSTSSTLYCLAPIIKILEDKFGVSEGFVTSIHAMTPSLKPLDGLCLRGKHWRDHRSIHQNIIPAATGACKALGKLLPRVKDKLSGLAFRVPIVNVSVLDLSVRLAVNTNLREIVKCVENASLTDMKNIITTSYDDSVSSDYIGDKYSCTLDVSSCLQLKPNFYKLICWYENEYSYACRVVDTILFVDELQLFKKIDITIQNINKVKENVEIINISCRSPGVITTNMDASNRDEQLDKYSMKNDKSNIILNREYNSEPHKHNRDVKENEVNKIQEMTLDEKKLLTQCNINAKNDCIKTQERLEKVKKEFSKIVTITEDLLKKSCKNKFYFNKSKEGIKGKDLKNIVNDTIDNENCKGNNQVKQNDKMHSDNNAIKTNIETTKNEIIKDYGRNDGISLNSFRQISNPIVQDIMNFKKNKNLKHFKTYVDNNDHNTSVDNNDKIASRDKGKSAENVIPKEIPNQYNDMTTMKIEIESYFKQEICNVKQKKEAYDEGEDNLQKVNSNKYSTKENILNKLLLHYDWINSDRTINNNNSKIENVQHNNDVLTNIEENEDDDEQVNCTDAMPKRENTELNETKNTMDLHSTLNSSTETSKLGEMCNVRRVQYNKQGVYDKLDSVSGTDSENSFQINERKSQVINLNDLSNSLEDLVKLDEICRIIEISDELSDGLFYPLNNRRRQSTSKWSFKNLCERINLDDLCNNVFGKSEI